MTPPSPAVARRSSPGATEQPRLVMSHGCSKPSVNHDEPPWHTMTNHHDPLNRDQPPLLMVNDSCHNRKWWTMMTSITRILSKVVSNESTRNQQNWTNLGGSQLTDHQKKHSPTSRHQPANRLRTLRWGPPRDSRKNHCTWPPFEDPSSDGNKPNILLIDDCSLNQSES